MAKKRPAFSTGRAYSCIVAGEAALDGSNPTSIAHGLKSVAAVILTLKGSSAPGDNTSILWW